ncbi:MAG: hypothetical protein ACXVYY_01090 [Oryzihumus sp.]
MAIQDHVLKLDAAIHDAKVVLETLENLNGKEVRRDDPKDRVNRGDVANITRDLLYVQHLCDAVKVTVGDEYWSIRGRG